MEFRKQGLTVNEAKEIDLVDYLSSLGHKPVKIRNNDYWYLSPLRNEKIPSFKVNRKLNRWFDHGLGKGGNLIDFGVEYHRCTVRELLEKLGSHFLFQQPLTHRPEIINPPESKIKVLGDYALTSHSLLRYLEQRCIPVETARRYCREVRYKLNGKTWYGIGFKNDLGGWEIRNPFFKACSSPKSATTFKNDSNKVIIFEGFTDFLSFKALHKNLPGYTQDFVVLNSLTFFERARPFMEQHQSIHLYLDRDTTGKNYTRRALSLSHKYRDESRLYQNHKDFNDYLVNLRKPQKRNLRQRLKF